MAGFIHKPDGMTNADYQDLLVLTPLLFQKEFRGQMARGVGVDWRVVRLAPQVVESMSKTIAQLDDRVRTLRAENAELVDNHPYAAAIDALSVALTIREST